MKIIKIKKIITNIFRIIKVIQYQKTLWQMFVSVNISLTIENPFSLCKRPINQSYVQKEISKKLKMGV